MEGDSPQFSVNTPTFKGKVSPHLLPYAKTAEVLGKIAGQLLEGQLAAISISYKGELSREDTSDLKIAVVEGVLGGTTEEVISENSLPEILQSRGLTLTESRSANSDNYSSLLHVELLTSKGITKVTGTVEVRGEFTAPKVVEINDFPVDFVPQANYLLITDQTDQPGVIGKVASILAHADINIADLEVRRSGTTRGVRAWMIFSLDENPASVASVIENIEEIDSVKIILI